jgi:hypothetical protein
VNEGLVATRRPRLNQRLRQIPLGILLIAAVLGVLGLGSFAGGVYLMLEGGALRPWAAATALVMAPVVLYLAFQLLQLTRWAWVTLMALITLLFASSVIRFVFAPGLLIAPLMEIVFEATAAYYLLRPRVRAAFGR